jgi:hypothetical protein
MEMPASKFIAMEYYGLILNRTFEVYLLSDCLLGRKTGGIVGASPVHLTNKYQKAEAFVGKEKIRDEIDATAVLKASKANFRLLFSEIDRVEFLKKKKWGMGPVAHTGILNIYSKSGSKIKELIVLGDQEGELILNKIKMGLK